MGKYLVILETVAEKHFKQHLKSGDKSIIKKLDLIYQELQARPATGIGNPEQLKHDLSGFGLEN